MSFNLNASIPLMAQVANPVGSAQQGLQLGQQFQQAPLQNQLLQQRVDQQQQALAAGQAQAAQIEQNRVITSVAQGFQEISGLLDAGDFQGAVDVLTTRRARLLSENPNADTRLTDEAIQGLQSGDATLINRVKIKGQALLDAATSRGLIEPTATGKRVSADQLGFEETIKDFTEIEKQQARRVRAGIVAKAGSSAAERAAKDQELADLLVELEARKVAARTSAKIEAEAAGAPLVATAKSEIAAKVKLATAEATAKGEVLTSLKQAQAALPNLVSVVDQLKELAPIATHTFGGSLMDQAVKQSGFGSTKGATARAKFISIVNNQVLPLLKPTFGAAFTFQEGEALKATMGDPDAAPEEKIAQLNSFIEGKMREVENKEREIAADEAPTQREGGVLQIDANGNRAMVFPDGTFEEVQ